MKVLYLELGDQKGTREAFKSLGIDLVAFNFTDYSNVNGITKTNETFLNHVNEHKPDWIHAQLQMTNVITNESIVKARSICPGVIITNWSGDIRREVPAPLINKSNVVNYTLISNVGQIELYEKAGCKNVKYWQIGYDPSYMFPKFNAEFIYDVVFTANCYGHFPDSRLRKEIGEKLIERYGARGGVFGSGYRGHVRSVGMNEINDINNKSACVLSVSHFNDVSHYFSDRLLHSLASGRPVISYRFPGIESYFADRGDILVAHSIEEIFELIDYCKSNTDHANLIGRNGYLKVVSEHTFRSRILELICMLGISNKL